MSSLAARIEKRIAELEDEIAFIAPLVRERAQLLRARAVLRGEPEPLAQESIRRRITRENVFDYLTRHPGSHVSEIATGLGVDGGAVSAHPYRGKGRLFCCRTRRWYPVPPTAA